LTLILSMFRFRLWSTLLFVTLGACLPNKNIKEPDFIRAQKFGIRSLGLKTSSVSMELIYFNPNPFGLKLKNADLEVFLDNRVLGHSFVDTLIDIPAKDSFALPVKLDVDMKTLFPNAWAILSQKEVELSLKGKVRLGRGGIFVNFPVDYSGKQDLSIFRF